MRTACALIIATVIGCSTNPHPDAGSTSSGASASNSVASSGTGGHGGMASVSSSSVGSSGEGGAGGEGGTLPPKPIDCATLNPGFVCVEDDDCPPMTKAELDACGPWRCAFIVQPDPDAGIPGKRGCMLSPKP